MGAAEVYDNNIVIDMRSFPTWTRAGIESARKSGLTMIHTGIGDLEEMLILKRQIQDNSDHVLHVTSSEDILRARKEGKMGIMVSIEHPDAIAEGCSDMTPVPKTYLTLVEQFYNVGVRAIQPAYNRRTVFADGCTERTNGGLSWFGVELVEKMNELGMLVQPSHCGEQTTIDCIKFSKDPVCISHSGCRAVYDHPRSKSDEVLKLLADKGGFFGVFILGFFVGPDAGKITVNDIVAHIDHAVKVAGIDCVGIGTDYAVHYSSNLNEESYHNSRKFKYEPNRDPNRVGWVNDVNLHFPPLAPELRHPRKLLTIAEALEQKGYSDSAIEKIMGGNALRVVKEVLG